MTARVAERAVPKAQPRFATAPTPGRENRLERMAAIAHNLGTPFMPWQELVAAVGSEKDPDTGLPAYRTVVVTVPRQSGKTVEVLVFEIDRCIYWTDRPQLAAYSAQTGRDAAKKLVEDQVPLLMASKAKPLVARVFRAMGNESVTFTNGSKIVPLANTPDAGHGKTIHFSARDELWADSDDRRAQALIPAMATVDDAQDLVTSTAGTDDSVPLRRLVELGRKAVAEGRNSGIAYFEWSAPEGADPDDEDVWWGCMPALGYTQSVETIRQARSLMSDGEFRRAFLNQWWDAEDTVFPSGLWEACVKQAVIPEDRIVFGVDARPDLTAAAVVAADEQGRCEVIDTRPGSDWVFVRGVELFEKWRRPVVLDVAGPLGYLKDRFHAANVDVIEMGTRDVVHACQGFHDAVMSGRLRVRKSTDLDAAVKAAQKRKVGDAWMWSRYTPTDPSSLMAATLAVAAAASAPGDTEVTVWSI